jgi:hypothetical protein
MNDPEAPLFPYARVLSGRTEDRVHAVALCTAHAVALCTAFILIAAVLFGTLSFRPF